MMRYYQRHCHPRTYSSRLCISCCTVLLLLLLVVGVDALSFPTQPFKKSLNKGEESSATTTTTYRYFAFGSNVLPATMTALRRIQPLEATAAILPGYALKFDGSPDSRWEPSAAFVIPCPSSKSTNITTEPEEYVVHGVVYTLSPEDFAAVGRTEGVPFGYRWQRCQVYPYVGRPDENVGADCYKEGQLDPVDAVTLVSPRAAALLKQQPPDVPPSSSYLTILQEGADYWNLDASYQTKLQAVPTAQNLIIPQGLSGLLLKAAVFFASDKKNEDMQ